jgi:hypothetical protein
MKQQEETEALNDSWLRLRAPSALIAVIDKHVRSKKTNLSAFTRAAVIAALEADGVATRRLASNMKPRERELA